MVDELQKALFVACGVARGAVVSLRFSAAKDSSKCSIAQSRFLILSMTCLTAAPFFGPLHPMHATDASFRSSFLLHGRILCSDDTRYGNLAKIVDCDNVNASYDLL
jgi:hypothetical protein